MLQALGSVSCDIIYETGGTICYEHWVLHLVIYDKRDRKYDLLRALGSASCNIIHGPGSTTCYGHWVLSLEMSHTRQWIRFARGIRFCDFFYRTRARGCDLLRALGSASGDITHETKGYEFLRALGCASCDIRHETGARICYGHRDLCLAISHTRREV